MLYAVIDEAGAPLEVVPGEVFATTQLKVAEDEAEHYKVSAGEVIRHPLIHADNALECWGPADFDRYQVHQVETPEAPEGVGAVVYRLAWTDGRLTAEACRVPEPVPEEVERTKFLLELHGRPSKAAKDKTLLDDVEAAIEASCCESCKRGMKLYLDGMAVFHRASPKLEEIAQQIEWSAEFLDELFVAAAKQI